MNRTIRHVLAAVLFAGLILVCALIWVKEGRSPWTVTQYGSDEGNQKMFYAITNSKHELLLVDGGWDTDAELVRSVIDEHNGHVNAWIITHPHPDHCGAFNAIMAANTDGSVVVDKIYSTRVNRRRYEETARDFDVIEAYEIFDTLTKDADNVVYLEEGDAFDVIGLTGSVLHAWDSHVDALSVNLLNDGSLMFRLDAMRDSILFCGDVQSEMEKYIVPQHKNKLKATYVQCGHHGNWGLSRRFYELVDPVGAFVDAPSSIIDDEDGPYDGHLLRDYFQKKGVVLYRYSTAPNTVILR